MTRPLEDHRGRCGLCGLEGDLLPYNDLFLCRPCFGHADDYEQEKMDTSDAD